MCVQKFAKILRVGKFSDYSATGDMMLRRTNLFFGENGRGKSTLAAILRSLQTGDGDHISERMTLNRTGKPEVHLVLERNRFVKFKDGKWDCSPEAIEIFDINFVYDNIYVGHDVGHDHKRNTYKIIVGEKGVKLSEKVDELDEEIRKANSKISAAKQVVEAKIDGGMKIADFVKLDKVDDIDKQIAVQGLVIDGQKSANDIAGRAALSELTLPAVPDLGLLQKTIDDVSTEAEQLVAQHISSNLDEDGEQWIEAGYAYLGENTECPFCGQNVGPSKLIAAYKAYFNEKYAELKSGIAALLKSVDTAFGAAALVKAQGVLSGNSTHIEFWKRFITFDAPGLEFAAVEPPWKKLASACTDLLKRKAAALLDAITDSADLTAAIEEYNGVVASVEQYNVAIRAINKSIAEKKAATAFGNLAAEQATLSKLKNTKSRHDNLVNILVGSYEKEVKAKKQLETDKQTAKDALDLYANQIFAKYQTELNQLLMDFGAEFQIEGERNFIGGKPGWNYVIKINKQSVPLTDSKGKASMRNTLSIGDRSALALAFFLAMLAHDQNLKDKCVVFDDPVCSLDRFRMEWSVNQILKVAATAKQVFVLCHDPTVLKKIYDRLQPGEVKTLSIERHVGDSLIFEWDIDQATRSQYFQDYKTLSDFLINGRQKRELRDVARKIRPLLEENLRVRFPKEFETGWLGDFIKRIREANVGEPLESMQDQLQALTDLNEYSKHFHHSENPNADRHPVSETELKTFTTKAFEFIRGAA
jgi:wobble nucleotide-excising tRNase